MDKSFHYTNPQMVADLVKLVPFGVFETVLDAGSGKNKVWYKTLESYPVAKVLECELDDGKDFYEWNEKVDWVIGNPPYHESWKFTEHALKIATTGIAWLINNQALNSHMTPRRLQMMSDLGFHYTKIHVVADKRWFGRYYFIILEKNDNGGFITWNKKTY